ncbi:exopolyphosphatase [Nematocida sp. LUAm3]|nr:exopolyphosphatase [Nematocida sp. LUAm3]KAI5175193.1 exopolyphosphatase [Nematocida sp. LUAm2]KAI5178135.1 exopolyphosphatase [Nematocida sp. LUAm1]
MKKDSGKDKANGKARGNTKNSEKEVDKGAGDGMDGVLGVYGKIIGKSGFSGEFKRIQEEEWRKKKVLGVLGNPSCDQDSFIGSHVFGVIERRVSIVNMSRRIFECKKDLILIMRMVGLKIEDLVFLDGNELIKGEKKRKIEEIDLTITLIDHNLPEKLLSFKNLYIDRIIDHHPILEMKSFYGKLQSLNIDLSAGSCSSLVYRDILNRRDISDKDKFSYLLLLSIPIITDTSFLTNRTDIMDKKAVETLLSAYGVSSEEAHSLHKLLKNEKKCEKSIPMDLILLMDYKAFEYPPESNPSGNSEIKNKAFGISSVGYSFDEWIERDKESFLKEVEELRRNKRLSFFLINSKTKGRREFFLLPGELSSSLTEEFVKKVLFPNASVKKRELPHGVLVYATDTKLSRKLVAPRIYEFLHETRP